jgi:cyclic dehypoxanthinyl futalosine synthase
MFGHVETDADIVEHLFVLRDLQDRTAGFTSFIPWSFKPGDNPLGKEVPRSVHPAKYVRIIALARMVLDNFDHIQSSWFSENVSAGQLGLLAGADDFGGILVEENVLLQAGHERSTTEAKVKTIIRRAGFTPAQRDSYYKVLRTFEGPPPVGIQP